MGDDLGGRSLAGKRILIVEDRFLLADDLRRDLAQRGAGVVGPASTIDQARALIDGHEIDLAVLDIDLRGWTVYSLADELAERGIAVVFASGMPPSSVPKRWAEEAFVAKPISIRRLVATIEKAMTGAGLGSGRHGPVYEG